VTSKATATVILFAALILQACVFDAEKPIVEKPGESLPAKAPTAAVEKSPVVVAAVPVPQKVYPQSSTLAGLNGQQVSRLLGPAPFKRQDDPAEIWQYRTTGCTLDIFLYHDGQGSAFKVRHFEARGRNNQKVTEQDCFVDLIKAHENRGSG